MTVEEARKEAAKYEIKFCPISYSTSSNQRLVTVCPEGKTAQHMEMDT